MSAAMAANLGNALGEFVILEAGDERGEFAGLLLAGMGAEVIRLEPADGAASRKFGPFADDQSGPERSLHFWRYNLNKKSVLLDVDDPAANPAFEQIAAIADVIIDSGTARDIARRLEVYRRMRERNPRLIVCTITPFGLDGPYRDFAMTDLTQMAMGGIMAVCGYDPGVEGRYDTPPIRPAMWHAYHLASEYAALSITAALNFRDLTGEGQEIEVSIHEAVNTCTETSMPSFIYSGAIVKRQTARHAAPSPTGPWLRLSADNVWVNAIIAPTDREFRALVRLLDHHGVAHDLDTPEYADTTRRGKGKAMAHVSELIGKLVASKPAQEMFETAQALGLTWAPVRRPEDNLEDAHFRARGTFAAIENRELGRTVRVPASVATGNDGPHFSYTRGAPRLGEHTEEIFARARVAPRA